jgi:hypothetical protein
MCRLVCSRLWERLYNSVKGIEGITFVEPVWPMNAQPYIPQYEGGKCIASQVSFRVDSETPLTGLPAVGRLISETADSFVDDMMVSLMAIINDKKPFKRLIADPTVYITTVLCPDGCSYTCVFDWDIKALNYEIETP